LDSIDESTRQLARRAQPRQHSPFAPRPPLFVVRRSAACAARAVVARLAARDVPPGVCEAALGCRLVGIPKKTGSTRVLACGSALRRHIARAACGEYKALILAGVGRQQYGVGRKRGAESLHQHVSSLVQKDRARILLACDVANAFPSVQRAAVQAAVRAPADARRQMEHR
jgi:hypothetical protein